MTCPHCEAGHPRMPDGMHIQVSEQGIRNLGPCSRPPELAALRDPSADLERFHARVKALRDDVEATRAAAILRPSPLPVVDQVPQHYTDRDPGEAG